jgi:hypothetical protein
LHGSIKFIDESDFKIFKHKRDAPTKYVKDSPDSPDEESDTEVPDEAGDCGVGPMDGFIEKAFSF